MEKNKISLREILPLIVLCVLIALALIFIFLKGGEAKERSYYNYFDTVSVVSDFSNSSDEEFSELCSVFAEELAYYDKLFDIYESSEDSARPSLYDVNERAGSEAVKVSADTMALLKYSVDIYQKTRGEVNIAMGAVLSLWHKAREAALSDASAAYLPSAEELSFAALHCDISKLELDEENMTVRFLDPLMKLDVGAVAKGYAAERIAERIASLGYSGVAIDLGGNLRLIGEKPSGEGWNVGIQNPDLSSDNGYIKYLDVSDTSVVTSGDYERYYIYNGEKYHHIIDKDTLMPARYFSSVTVVTRDGALADSLSTAFFTMSYEDGTSLAREMPEIQRVIWVKSSGEVLEYFADGG